ncbi:MAG: hypothetical protein IIV79_02650, partial [Clostridia bacterium]|nr:hypothetical protein [Clostridia bacterium]
MKLTRNKVLVLALALSLLAIASMGTLAWFTDSDSVNNNFYIANSEDDPDKIFSVDVWEDATADDPDGEDKIQTGIDFDDILPGDDFYKEVNIENTGYYAQYVRATVTVTGAAVWQKIFGEVYVPLNSIATDLNSNFNVDRIVYNADKDTLTYVLYSDNILDAGEVDTLFTNVHIPEALNRFQAGKLSGEFAISVVADAVQTENVGDTAIAAFTTVGMYENAGKYTVMTTEAGLNAVLASGLVDTVVLNDAYAGKVTTISEDIANVTIDANGLAVGLKFTGVAANVTVTNIADTAEGTFRNIDLSAVKAGSSVTVTDSSFVSTNGTTSPAVFANMNSDLAFDDCVFNGSADKTYFVYGFSASNMTFTNCEFKALNKSWAVQINGTIYGNVTIDNCTYTDCKDGIFKGSVAGGGHNGLLNGDFTFTNN